MTDRKFSHSSMSKWRRCRQAYKWSYIDNLTTPSSSGLARGSACHEALANWYKNMDQFQMTVEEQTVRDMNALTVASDMYTKKEIEMQVNLEEDWVLTELILRRYFNWAREHDNFTKIIALEQKFDLEISGNRLIGYIDGIVEINGGMWLLEHKFNKRVSLTHIDLDAQMSIYMMAAKIMGMPVKGVLFNVVRVAEGGVAKTNPVVRTQVYRNNAGLNVVAGEVALQMKEMANFHDNGGIVYRNPTRDCSWDCGFYSACLAMNDDGDPSPVLEKFPKKEIKVDLEEEEAETDA